MIISLRLANGLSDNERVASLVPALVPESWSFRTFWCTCHKEGHKYNSEDSSKRGTGTKRVSGVTALARADS